MHVPGFASGKITPAQAAEIQRELARQVVEQDQLGRVNLVAGVDVGFEGENNRTARAAVVVLSRPGLTPVDYGVARMPVTFPYIPGLLAFREMPVILRALAQLDKHPDVIIADGHGRAHPRRMGIACHLGLALDMPAIGCAKSILVGHTAEPEQRVGAWTPLLDSDEVIGATLRTRVKAKPVYVSIGHRISLERAIEVVLECCRGYRLPETTRYAHRVAGGERLEIKGGKARKR